MTSSSSLYGTVTQQNSSSANSTGLYGDANTPIPDASGNLVVRGDLYVLSGNILTTATTGNLFPTNATTVNVGLAATAVNIGSATGNTTINNNLVVDGSINGYTLPAVDGQNTQVLSTDGSGNLYWAQNFDTTYTIGATATTGGTNFNLVGNDISTDTIKFANGTGIAVTRTDASTITFSNTGVTLPYNIDATATTGGANLNLTDGLTTDTVKFASGTNTAVTRTDANTITFDTTLNTYNIDAASTTGGVNLNLTGSDSSTDTVKFTNGTGIVISSIGPGAMTITNTGVVDPYSIDATATGGGANFNLTNALGTDTIKFAGIGGTTVTRTNDSLITIDSIDTNTTYNFAASLTPNGANLNLTGSDATTDTVKLTDGGHITAIYTSDTVVTLGSDATSSNTANAIVARDSSGNFSAAGATLGNVNVGVDTNNTVSTTSGDLVLDSFTDLIRVGAVLQVDSGNVNVMGTAIAGSKPFVTFETQPDGANPLYGIRGQSTVDDPWFVGAGSTGNDGGYVEIATGDNAGVAGAASPIYARQYNGFSGTGVPWYGGTGTVVNEFTLLDADGNTIIPNALDVGGKLTLLEIQSTTGGAGPAGGLNLYSNDASNAIHIYDNYVQIVSGTSPEQDWIFRENGTTSFPNYTFPAADGTANQVLTTDGAGNVTWALPGGGGSTFGNVSIGVVTDNTISTTTGALDITAAGTNSVNITSGSLGPTLISRTSTPTNTNIRSLGLNSQTSGTPAVGIGNSIEFSVETATGVTTAGGYLSVTSTDITPGAEDFKLSIGLMDNGATYSEVARFESTGNLFLDGRVYGPGAQFDNVTVSVDSAQAISTTSGNLVLQTAAGVSAGTITLAAGANGAITVAPNGTGNLTTTFNDGGNIINNRNYVLGAVRNATQLAAGDIGFAGLRGISLDNSSATTKRPGIMVRSYGGGLTSGAPRSAIATEAARGTAAVPVNLNSGDFFGEWIGNGYTSTGWSNEIAVASPAIVRFATAEAWDSGTAKVGARFQVALMPASTTYSAANLRQVLDISPDTFNTTSDLYTLKNKAGTTNLTLSSTGDLVVTGDIRVNGNNIQGSGGLAAIDLTSANTLTTVRGNTTLLNTAADVTYASISSTGQTFTSTGRMNIIRTTPGTGVLLRQQTANANPVDGENTDFRLSVAGTVTSSDFARFDGTYRSSGDNEIGLSVSADSFVADTDRIYIGSRAKTQIQTTPAGGGTTGTTAEFTQLATTIKSDQVNLQTAAGVGVTGNKISYNRVYGQWQYDATITPAAANTGYAVPFQGVNAAIDFANIATASNTSEIRPNALGMYKLQFSAQVQNSDNGADHQVTFWWRKNGVDISNSAGYFTVPKAAAATGSLIVGWDNMVEVTTITDYYQLMYAVSSTSVTLPFIAASAPRPGAAAVFLTLVPVGA